MTIKNQLFFSRNRRNGSIERNVNRVQVLTWTPVCIVERKECETKRKKTDESKHCEQERTREEREEEEEKKKTIRKQTN